MTPAGSEKSSHGTPRAIAMSAMSNGDLVNAEASHGYANTPMPSPRFETAEAASKRLYPLLVLRSAGPRVMWPVSQSTAFGIVDEPLDRVDQRDIEVGERGDRVQDSPPEQGRLADVEALTDALFPWPAHGNRWPSVDADH